MYFYRVMAIFLMRLLNFKYFIFYMHVCDVLFVRQCASKWSCLKKDHIFSVNYHYNYISIDTDLYPRLYTLYLIDFICIYTYITTAEVGFLFYRLV